MNKSIERKNTLIEIAKVFFKLGLFAFGGPAAHIAMMEEEIINKRKWMTREHFLDLIGATNLIPGPNSTEMTMHCGHERGGMAGLIIAGLSFILPAVSITGVLAWLYIEYGQLPQIEPFIIGIKPAVLSVILAAIIKLGKKAVKTWELGFIGIVVIVACLLGLSEVTALLTAGVLGAIYFKTKSKLNSNLKSLSPILLLQLSGVTLFKASTLSVFWTFLKVGTVLYGSGYVLFAYLDAELVTQGWLTRTQLMDAIAVGQFTPGPVLSTATFIGYQLGGTWGAVAATAGIFLPSFIFVLILNPLIPKMRSSKLLSYFLDSVNVAAVAVMVSVLYEMGRETLIDVTGFIIAIVSLVLTFGFKKVNSMWIIILGALLGWLLNNLLI